MYGNRKRLHSSDLQKDVRCRGHSSTSTEPRQELQCLETQSKLDSFGTLNFSKKLGNDPSLRPGKFCLALYVPIAIKHSQGLASGDF